MTLEQLAAATKTTQREMAAILAESEEMGDVERRGELWALTAKGAEHAYACLDIRRLDHGDSTYKHEKHIQRGDAAGGRWT